VALNETDSKLAEARAAFRAHCEEAGIRRVWEKFSGRIALVLAGGGARGAYQAGALLAFQDAAVPTHIITAASVGSINAAGYAATSSTLVGNAEPLVEHWARLTERDLGVEWTRWMWMLLGLLAASAGFGNLLWYAAGLRGIRVQIQHPGLTWLALGLAGIVVLFTSDKLPYLGYVIRNLLQGGQWQPDPRKAALSMTGNVIFWTAVAVVLDSVLADLDLSVLMVRYGPALAAGLLVLLLLILPSKRWAPRLGVLARRLLRITLHTGLFTNYERARILREVVTNHQLSASPIRLVITVADLESGSSRFFCNTPAARLIHDPGADPSFVRREIQATDDLVGAVVASSALPIAFEPVRIAGRACGDGGLCANEPIRPAVRLGADVVFLVMMNLPGMTRHRVGTFIDVGLCALDILMQQSLQQELGLLSTMNSVCEQAAASLGVRPEEVEIVLGNHRFRHVRCFAICPPQPLAGATLHSNPRIAAANLLCGYLDAQAQILNFLEVARIARYAWPRRMLNWSPAAGDAMQAAG